MGVNPGRQTGVGRWPSPLFAGFFLVALPATSRGHALIRGSGEFSAGLLHPLITPAHLLLLLAMGLWLGQHPPLRLRVPMLLFTTFSAVGLLASAGAWTAAPAQPVLVVIALCMALSVAVSARPPVWVRWPGVALAALAVGLDSGVDPGPPLAAVATALAGTWISLSLCALNFSYYTSLCPQKKWAHIGVRVAGSWIAAICLLLLAFSFRG